MWIFREPSLNAADTERRHQDAHGEPVQCPLCGEHADNGLEYVVTCKDEWVRRAVAPVLMDVLRVVFPEQLVEEQKRPMKSLQWDRVLRALRACLLYTSPSPRD